jgi:tyrosinase
MHQTDNNTSTLISTINALYGPDATSPQKRSIDPNPIHQPKLHPRRIAGAPTFSGQRQYLTNIKVQKFGLNGSFKIFIFLGRHEPGRNPSTWVKESSFIGVAGILSQPMGVDSAVLEVEAHGSVPLTAALEAKIRSGELKSMREGVVERFLNGHLRWRILTVSLFYPCS